MQRSSGREPAPVCPDTAAPRPLKPPKRDPCPGGERRRRGLPTTAKVQSRRGSRESAPLRVPAGPGVPAPPAGGALGLLGSGPARIPRIRTVRPACRGRARGAALSRGPPRLRLWPSNSGNETSEREEERAARARLCPGHASFMPCDSALSRAWRGLGLVPPHGGIKRRCPAGVQGGLLRHRGLLEPSRLSGKLSRRREPDCGHTRHGGRWSPLVPAGLCAAFGVKAAGLVPEPLRCGATRTLSLAELGQDSDKRQDPGPERQTRGRPLPNSAEPPGPRRLRKERPW